MSRRTEQGNLWTAAIMAFTCKSMNIVDLVTLFFKTLMSFKVFWLYVQQSPTINSQPDFALFLDQQNKTIIASMVLTPAALETNAKYCAFQATPPCYYLTKQAKWG